MPSLSRPVVPIGVEFDKHGKRVVRHFTDCFEARRFFVAKDRQGKRPRVVRV